MYISWGWGKLSEGPYYVVDPIVRSDWVLDKVGIIAINRERGKEWEGMGNKSKIKGSMKTNRQQKEEEKIRER